MSVRTLKRRVLKRRQSAAVRKARAYDLFALGFHGRWSFSGQVLCLAKKAAGGAGYVSSLLAIGEIVTYTPYGELRY